MNIVFAGYVPSTGILIAMQQFASAGDPPCNLVITQDASGNALIQAGDSSTQVDGDSSSPPEATPGLTSVNVGFINDGHVLTVQGFKGDTAALNVSAGQGTGSLTIQGSSVFKGGLHYSAKGPTSVSISADSQIGAGA